MQLWLHICGGSVGAQVALSLVAVIALGGQSAQGNGSMWGSMPSSGASTLDAHIAPQDLDLHPVVDLLGPTTAPPPKAQPPKAPPELQGPSLVAPARPRTDIEKPSPTSKPIDSPFKKWVSPKSSSTEAEAIEAARPLVTAPAPAEVEGETAGPEAVAAPTASSRRATPSQKVGRSTRPTDRSRAESRAESTRNEASTAEVSDKLPTAKARADQSASAPTTPKVPGFLDPNSARASSKSRRAANLPPLSAGKKRLRSKIRQVLAHYYNRPLNSRDRSPWEMMHAMLAYEVNSQILQGGPRGKPVTAVGWLCFNQACRRRTLMYVNDDGKMRVRIGPALQGHRGQLLAMLAQCKVSKDYPMRIEGQDFTVADLIKMEMETCYPRSELTFKLIALMHYLKSDATWMNDQGYEWNLPKLVAEELRQPIRGAACGGTHRLSGLTLAYKTRQKRGEPVDGQYRQAQRFIARYQQYAYRLQNRDGSFSTEWFRGPGNEESLDRKLKTTGHLLEWLLYAATEKELHHWKTTKAANYLANIMYNNRYKNWEAGPLGHAIHALLLYDRLVFAPYDGPAELPVAGRSKPSRAARAKR